MKKSEGKHVLIYEGNEWESELMLSLLKANGIQSAVLINNQDSAYKSIFNHTNQLFVHESEENESLNIIAANSAK